MLLRLVYLLLLKFNGILVVIHKHLEVMLQDCAGLSEGIVRCHASVGPHLEHEAVVVSSLADAGVLDIVAHARDWREHGVDRDHANRLVRCLVVIASAETAAGFHRELHEEFFLFIQRANQLLRIHQLCVVIELNVGRSHCTRLVHGEQQHLGLAGLMDLELHPLEVEDDLRHVLNHTVDGGEFMLGTIHLQRGNGRTLK